MPSDDDRSAYAKVGSLYDKLSAVHPYADEFFKTIEAGRDPLAKGSRIAAALETAGNVTKAVDVYQAVKSGLDQYARQGGEFALTVGLKIVGEIASKALGSSIENHPYYALQKPGLELLGKVLTAKAKHDDIISSYRSAVSAADVSGLSSQFAKLDERRGSLNIERGEFLAKARIASDLLVGAYGGEMAQRKIKEGGGAAELIRTIYVVDNWRASWAGLAFDSMKLSSVMTLRLKAARAAMAKVAKLVQELTTSDSAGRVAGYGAVNKIEWEKYDRIVKRGQASRMVMDPVAFAESNLARANAWSAALADMVDVVRTKDMLYDSKWEKKMMDLMNLMRIHG